MSAWQTYLQENKDRYLKELIDFLSIPSISSLSEHADDVREAAKWVQKRLGAAGVEAVQIMETGGHPVVYGHWLHAPGQPTLMIYGHFDTQPVDPLDLWSQPPFEPTIRHNRIYARGASDDKGNMLIPILAVEAMLKTDGRLPLNVKFFFEGQEEIGSPQLPEFTKTHADLLKSDLVLSADGGQWEEGQPAITLGLRGLCALQIDVKGAEQDVHSGAYGGTFMNPIHALAQMVASFHEQDGRVAVHGFYDGVLDPDDTERGRIRAVPYNDDAYKKELGVSDLFGEPGFSTYERVWVRPTLELNGIWGGFQDEGGKTVIPSLAHAKISCRLVPNQDPYHILERITEHIRAHTPAGVAINIQVEDSVADPYRIPSAHPGNRAAAAVHKTVFGKEPYYVYNGASIPICGLMKKYLNADTVNFAFGLKDENPHAPDEFLRLEMFALGQRAYGLLLEEVGKSGL